MKNSQQKFRKILLEKKKELNFTLKDIEERSKTLEKAGKGLAFSSSYYSQVQTGSIPINNVTYDVIWTLSQIFGLDPGELYVLSRTKIKNKYIDEEERKNLFNSPVEPKINPDGYYIILSENPVKYMHERGFATEKKSQAKRFSRRLTSFGKAQKRVQQLRETEWPAAYIEEIWDNKI